MTPDAEPTRPTAESVEAAWTHQLDPGSSLIPDRVSVVVVDDHPLVASSVADALNATETITVLAIATTCATGLAAVTQYRPDIVLLDQNLPDGLGTDLLPEMLAASSGTKVLMMTGQDIDDVLTCAVYAGAAGVITKASRVVEIISAVNAVARDEAVIVPKAIRRPRWNSSTIGVDLTATERAVLQLLVAGVGAMGTADALVIAPAAARHHIQMVTKKLGAHNRLEVVAIAIRANISP